MNPNDESSLFLQALETPVDERAAFLAAACAGDDALRQRLEALLAAHEVPDTMLSGQTDTARPAGRLDFTRDRPEEVVGQRLGPFKLLEKVGEGGCGVVYVAEQTEPVRRRVALKVIKLGMDTKQVVARFEAERQALAIMDHPNIAKVLDAGTTEHGRPYFVMELVRGICITDYCDQANLSTIERLDLFIKVCHAIQHAHQKGIIHRDIKPSNILVTLHDGVPVPKVIDFGIAKATDGRLTDATIYTQLHQFMGTPAYMSPEQAEMSGLDIDTRSDIYSLGVLLYELLTGSTPFDAKELMASGLDAMRKTIREKEPMRPSTKLSQTLVAADVRRLKSPSSDTQSSEEEVRASSRRLLRVNETITLLKGDLDWIVMKCLEKDRTRRYETANGVAADIKRHLVNDEVLARPPSSLYRMQKTWQRNKLVFSAGIAIAAALALGITISLWLLNEATKARHAADLSRIAEQEQKSEARDEAERANLAEKSEKELRLVAEQQELAARRRAYAADMRLCQQALAVNNLREARQLLDRQRPSEGRQDLRGWEWRHLWQRCQPGTLFELGTHKKRVLTAQYANGGRSVMTFEDGGKVSRWNLESRTEEAMFQARELTNPLSLISSSGYMSVSDDGEWVASVVRKASGDFAVRVWDVRQGNLLAEFPAGPHRAQGLAFSPDRKSLTAFFSDTDVARIWDIEEKAVAREISIDAGTDFKFYGAIQYSRDGQWLAIGGGAGYVHLLDIKAGTARKLPITGHGGISTLAFSPDGRSLVIGRAFIDPNIRVMDVESGKEIRTLSGHCGYIAKVAFSPDGGLLASASGDQTIKLWDTGTWEERATLRGHTDEVWSVDFSADGKTLLSGGKDAHVFVWPVSGANERDDSTLLPDPDQTSVDVSPDGKRFVTIATGVVHLWGATNSVHNELGTNNVSASWVAPEEILLGGNNPPQIRVWNLDDQTVAAFSLKSREGEPTFLYLPIARVLVAAVWNAARDETALTRWDVATRRELSTCTITGTRLRQRRKTKDLQIVISQDSRSLAVPRRDGFIEIYDLATGQVRSRLEMPTDMIKGMALSPDARWFACARRNVPSVEIWDVATGQKHLTLPGHNLVLMTMQFSPDGRRLITSTIGTEPIRLWDTEGWHTVFSFEPTPETFLWLPRHLSDGNTLAFNEGKFDVLKDWMRLWQAPSWAEIEATEAGKTKAAGEH